ncbi:hypothetical protein P154DRAFT_579965 [Amniculicola lignicola CBS 123094]|uniref:Uncharacterized protein n=1 Tax=Amniculicola lignicola CBS 123094 TaxID=1392246 RepID=A0A6A5W6D1_9PLEO|nr:hypothetical protein P154DRAFT_579965 [Amniculicola lignicola CBS 123094]
MPLLPKIQSEHVRTGWWQNLTAPPHRQYLWTAKNFQALMFFGCIGICGTIASNSLWTLTLHFLQPTVHIPDSDDPRPKLSRIHAIRALSESMRNAKEDLKLIWKVERGFRRQLSMSVRAITGNPRQIIRRLDHPIEQQFGIFAIANIATFVVLGIFVPFLLAEGLQGETIVQPEDQFHNRFTNHCLFQGTAAQSEYVRRAVRWSFNECIERGGEWGESARCVTIRKALPPYRKETIQPTDPIFAKKPYLFLHENGIADTRAIKLSRNLTYKDIGMNIKSGGLSILHELVCIPIDLDGFISHPNGTHQLKFRDFLPRDDPDSDLLSDSNFHIHDTMILKTSNAAGSGHEMDEWHFNQGPDVVERDIRNLTQGRSDIFFQRDMDGVLPWITTKPIRIEDVTGGGRLGLIQAITHERLNFHLQNFLITLKPAWFPDGQSVGPLDDPIFGAFDLNESGKSRQDREVLAIGCAEVFKSCSISNCVAVPMPSGRSDGPMEPWLASCYKSIMSVWANTIVNPLYSRPDSWGYWPNTRILRGHRHWYEDVEERFLHSMLRVQYATTAAAEHDSVSPQMSFGIYKTPDDNMHMLYLNSDFTNINIWGTLALLGAYFYIIIGSYWLILLSPLTLSAKLVTDTAIFCMNTLHALGIKIWNSLPMVCQCNAGSTPLTGDSVLVSLGAIQTGSWQIQRRKRHTGMQRTIDSVDIPVAQGQQS